MNERERSGIKLHGDNPDQPTSAAFDPRDFSLAALREIIRYQIFRKDPVQIHLQIDPHQHMTIDIDTIKERAKIEPDLRKFILDTTAGSIYNALRVTIRIAEAKKKV